MLVYFDDVLHLATDTQEYMLNLNQVYLLKGGFGPPDRYLGANIDKFQLEDGINVWSMNCVEYLCRDIENIGLIIEGNQEAMKSFGCGDFPYPSSYSP